MSIKSNKNKKEIYQLYIPIIGVYYCCKQITSGNLKTWHINYILSVMAQGVYYGVMLMIIAKIIQFFD